jgi:GT2 family glycosyltransferase
MKTIDVIILSYAKNDEIINMNNNCINSILNSTTNYKFNIFLIETDSTKEFEYPQENVKVIQPGLEFNYNKFLNIGLKECKSDWILISNNDTIYHKGFIERMFDIYNFNNEILSMSPMDDDWKWHANFDRNIDFFYGYRTSFEVAGWSILINKSVFEKIGEFDEQFSFWYQDNDYANSLIKNNIKHALVTNSKVTHLVSKSHDLIDQEKIFEMTGGLFSTFENKWLKNK